MTESSLRRHTGIFGLVATLLSLTDIPAISFTPVPLGGGTPSLVPGQFLLWGAIGRHMTTLFLSASGFALLRGRLMPAWLAWLAFRIALINLVFVPAMFFGYDAGQFYSAVGWGTTAMAPVLVVWWIIIASIIMLRTPAN